MAIPFVGGSYELKRKKADTQRSINLMPTPVESGSGKSGMYLAPVPGLTVFDVEEVDPPESPCFVERFLTFEEDYSYAGPAIARYEVSPTPYANTLFGPSHEETFIYEITRAIPPIVAGSIAFKFMIPDTSYPDDAIRIHFEDHTDPFGPTRWSFIPVRESSIDPGQRALMGIGTGTSYFVTDSVVEEGVWYQVLVTFGDDALVRITKVSDGSLFSEFAFSGSFINPFDQIAFTGDSGLPTTPTYYADIHLCPVGTVET